MAQFVTDKRNCLNILHSFDHCARAIALSRLTRWHSSFVNFGDCESMSRAQDGSQVIKRRNIQCAREQLTCSRRMLAVLVWFDFQSSCLVLRH
jgi:hypothetical protein